MNSLSPFSPVSRSRKDPQSRTHDHTHQNDSVNGSGTFRVTSPADPTLRDRFVVPSSILRGDDRPTMPAPASFEELQYRLVDGHEISIEEARRNVETYRELRNLSAARLLGGAL